MSASMYEGPSRPARHGSGPFQTIVLCLRGKANGVPGRDARTWRNDAKTPTLPSRTWDEGRPLPVNICSPCLAEKAVPRSPGRGADRGSAFAEAGAVVGQEAGLALEPRVEVHGTLPDLFEVDEGLAGVVVAQIDALVLVGQNELAA